jgi:uncharacterized CHY-type Zn-finger protein
MVIRARHHFCSNGCQRAWNKDNPVSTQPQTNYVTVLCGYCEKPLQLTEYRASQHKQHYCGPECYHRAKQDFYSGYTYRNLENTPKQLLVRFLVMHGVGQSGYPGEELIIQVKSGYLVPELSPIENPLELVGQLPSAVVL